MRSEQVSEILQSWQKAAKCELYFLPQVCTRRRCGALLHLVSVLRARVQTWSGGQTSGGACETLQHLQRGLRQLQALHPLVHTAHRPPPLGPSCRPPQSTSACSLTHCGYRRYYIVFPAQNAHRCSFWYIFARKVVDFYTALSSVRGFVIQAHFLARIYQKEVLARAGCNPARARSTKWWCVHIHPLCGRAHPVYVEGPRAWWAEVCFPRVSNLHLRISVFTPVTGMVLPAPAVRRQKKKVR